MRKVLISAAMMMPLIACGPESEPRAPDSSNFANMDRSAEADRRGALGMVDSRALSSAPPSAVGRPAPPARGVPADATLSLPAPGGGGMPVIAPSLAYEYSYALELPADKARSQLTAHQSACEAAGPAVCQVISAESYAVGAKEARGLLEMRATADWLRQFRGRLESDAGAAGGKMLSVTTRTEDLTRSMVDTEAAIRSQQILQDRMERLLAERTGNLDQAVRLEQQIAQTRAGIDAMRSSLEVMRGRTAMQKLTIEYSVSGAKPPPGMKPDLAPLAALKSVGRNMLEMLAILIILTSYLAPLGLLAWGGWWLLRRFRKSPRPTSNLTPTAPPS